MQAGEDAGGLVLFFFLINLPFEDYVRAHDNWFYQYVSDILYFLRAVLVYCF